MADDAWQAELEKTFGRHAGDARYTPRGHGQPGTPLAAAWDAYRTARSAWESLVFAGKDAGVIRHYGRKPLEKGKG